MLTTQEHAAWAMRVREAVRTRSIETADRKTLIEFSTWLCEPGASSALSDSAVYEQSCELVRLHLLLDYMRKAERRSSVVQWCVVALTVVSIAASVVQVSYAIKSERRSQRQDAQAELERQAKQSQASDPILAEPPANRQASSPARAATSTDIGASAGK